MGDDKDTQQQDPSKKVLEEGVKAAANAYAGPVGGKVAEAAMKTKAGQEILNKGAQNLNNLPGMGKLPGVTPAGSQSSGSNTDASGGLDEFDTANPLDISSRFKGSGSSKGEGTFDLLNNNSIKKKLIIGAAGFLSIALIFLLIFAILYGPIDSIKSFIQGTWDKVVDFFSKDVSELEEQYYQKLEDVRDDKRSEFSLCIDINMIQAALTVNDHFENVLIEGNCIVNDDGTQDCSESTKNEDVAKSEKKELKRMMKQVEILANMQVKTITYGYDKNLKSNDYCVPCDKSIDTVYTSGQLVDSTNQGDFKYTKSDYKPGDIGYDSLDSELVSKHDMNSNWSKFFTKKSDEEKNYEFHFYIPYGTYGTEEVDDNVKCYVTHKPNGDTYSTTGGMEEVASCYCSNTCGNTSNSNKKKTKIKCNCDNTLPEDTYELSIGNYETRKENVFYWNLLNSFIPDYYDEYLKNLTPEEKDKKIKEIADDIYLLYDEFGPNQSCATAFDDVTFGSSDLCTNGEGIKVVDGNDNLIGVYELEEYVAGVVSAEAHFGYAKIEALKAQAVAARTYVLVKTNGCEKAIVSSQTDQVFTSNVKPLAKEATVATAGEVLKFDGELFLSEYDSWNCKESNNCTYTKLPKYETHQVSLSDYYLKSAAGGHGRGMSQMSSYEMADNGDDYKTILKYFYSPGVEINQASSNNSGVVGPWSSWRQYSGWWANLPMPSPSNTCTKISNCGCAITSVAIQIARSGVPTILGDKFDVGTFYQKMKQVGGFSGNNIYWSKATDIAPSFKWIDSVNYISPDQIRNYMRNGYYIVAGVNSGGHWVALTGLAGDRILMTDPGTNSIDFMQKYNGTIVKLKLYKVG